MKLFWLKTKFTWIASLTKHNHIPPDSRIIKYAKPEVRKLCTRLLEIGGERVAILFEDSKGFIQFLVDNGKITPYRKIILEVGEERECHSNSALLWQSNKKKYKIVTGFALSDNTWRRHSWVMASGDELVETTVIRDKYFGTALKREIAEAFALVYEM